MDDISSFGPSGVVAVGLKDTEVEKLQEECSARRYRLVVATRTSDLPLSLQCDFAIVNTLLPDGDGRKLAVDFARAGARVLLVDSIGSVPLYDAWSLGAAVPSLTDTPADWLDSLAHEELVDAVSRAGRLMEPLRLADAVDAAAAFSGSSGVPVSFVRIRPPGGDPANSDDMLDRLTSVVGMTTVFYDAPSGERTALVVNGDRRRLAKLLDNPHAKSQTAIAVVEVSPEDDLLALLGRSLVQMEAPGNGEERTKVLVALAPGHEKTTEIVRMALHRMDYSPVFWDAAFRFEETKSNRPSAVVVDVRQEENVVIDLIAASLSQQPPIPVLAISDQENVKALRPAIRAGASDFLTAPIHPGDVQSALARVIVVGGRDLRKRYAEGAPAKPEVAATAPEVPAAGGEPERVDEQAAVSAREDSSDNGHEAEAATETVQDRSSESKKVREAPEAAGANGPEPALRPSVETFFTTVIAERLASGETVELEGLGTLAVRHETSRIIHDKQGRTIVEPPRRTLRFFQERTSNDDAENK